MSGGPRRVCLFAQFHPRNRIRPPVLHYVRELAAAGFETFVACSGDGPPPDEDCAALAAAGARVFCRPNRGLDFGAWQHLLRRGCADGADSVLLANDSVFGPLRSLRPLLDGMNRRGYDAWGMVESHQRGWHLQSWFLHFTGEAFRAPEVRWVFAQDFGTMGKDEVIAAGELGLGQALRQAGLRCGAFVPFRTGTWVARRYRMNRMHIDWCHNLLVAGLPFIKIELLRSNPMGLPWTPAWERILRQRLGVATADLTDYLYDYTGQQPPWPGAPFQVPAGPIPPKRVIGFTLATHDRSLAVRETLRAWASRLFRSSERRYAAPHD